jgi:methylmalonyl-CoA/ethylmalonyl-CoA epimerase
MVRKLAHIAIAVKDAEAASKAFAEGLGLEKRGPEVVEGQGVRVMFLPVGETKVELVEPLSEESGIAKFLGKKGEGLHHIAFEVDDIKKAIEKLIAAGVQMIDMEPRVGAGGKLVAFAHPKSFSGVLVELVQA